MLGLTQRFGESLNRAVLLAALGRRREALEAATRPSVPHRNLPEPISSGRG